MSLVDQLIHSHELCIRVEFNPLRWRASPDPLVPLPDTSQTVRIFGPFLTVEHYEKTITALAARDDVLEARRATESEIPKEPQDPMTV